MQKPTAKQITDSYKRIKAKPRDKRLNKFIESVCLELLFAIQDKTKN